MSDDAGDLLAFLGVPADPRLLGPERDALPPEEARTAPVRAPAAPSRDVLVGVGSALTGVSLVGGALLALGAAVWLLAGGGALAGVALALGVVLIATHWGWVHVAEYVSVSRSDRAADAARAGDAAWLAELAPYPRFGVWTRVGDDAATHVERVRFRPVLTPAGSFTFVREVLGGERFDADASTVEIAEAVETARARASEQTAVQEASWEAAASAYRAELDAGRDDAEHHAARHAAATALSEHVNARLLEARGADPLA